VKHHPVTAPTPILARYILYSHDGGAAIWRPMRDCEKDVFSVSESSLPPFIKVEGVGLHVES
jgi:hypothetical protein